MRAVLSPVVRNDILHLTRRLVQIRSVDGDRKALEQALETAVQTLKSVGFTIERFVSNGYPSVLAYPTTHRPKRFRLLFNGHLDVVPGKAHQYHPTIAGGKLYGVGSMDMKANVAAMVHALRGFARSQVPVGIQLVTDEQVGGVHGTLHQIQKGVRADFVIAGESTNLNIAHASKGILWLQLRAQGKSAHGAYPWRGKNALLLITEAVQSLIREFEEGFHGRGLNHWVSTLNVARIETPNTAYNKVPDEAFAYLDVRFIPEEGRGNVLGRVRRALPSGVRVTLVMDEPAMWTPEDLPDVMLLQQVTRQVVGRRPRLYRAQGSSDARHFARVGGFGVEFGPVGGGRNTDREWVDIESVFRFAEVLSRYIQAVIANKAH